MKNKILDILCIIMIIAVVLLIGIFVYKAATVEEDNVLEAMVETIPEPLEKNIVEEKEETDELVIKEYEIDGKTYEVIAVLYIPTLEIEYPVLSSTSKELLKVSLNKYWGPNPNKVGNFCIVGHNYNDDRFFGKLNKIQIGDVIQLTDMTGKTLQYYVYETYIVDPEDTNCTSQLTNDKAEITLITCTKNFKQRFIVKASVE